MTRTILLASAALSVAGAAHAAYMAEMSGVASGDRGLHVFSFDTPGSYGDLRRGLSFVIYESAFEGQASYVEPRRSSSALSQIADNSAMSDAAQGMVAVLQGLQSSVKNQRQSGSDASPTQTQGSQGGGSQSGQGLVSQGGQGNQGSQGQGSQGGQGDQGQSGGGVGGQPAIPEISTWAMLVAGVGMIGVALRRRSSGGLKA
jgi:hypothetical protein